MVQWLTKIWKDPVLSKVIAAGILTFIAVLYQTFTRRSLFSWLTNSIPIWWLIIIMLIILFIFWIRNHLKVARNKSLINRESNLPLGNDIISDYGVFLTSPMSGFKTDEEYTKDRNQLMTILSTLRKTKNVNYVYFYGEDVPSLEKFENADVKVSDYLAEIDKTEFFIAVISKRLITSVYFEAGYALAQGKKSIYFVKDREGLPFLMRSAPFYFPNLIRIYKYTSVNEIINVLQSKEAFK